MVGKVLEDSILEDLVVEDFVLVVGWYFVFKYGSYEGGRQLQGMALISIPKNHHSATPNSTTPPNHCFSKHKPNSISETKKRIDKS